MKVIFFSAVADAAGTNEWFPGRKVNDTVELIQLLLDVFPVLDTMTFAIAVNKKVIHGNVPLAENDQVALLPPFSGG